MTLAYSAVTSQPASGSRYDVDAEISLLKKETKALNDELYRTKVRSVNNNHGLYRVKTDFKEHLQWAGVE